jgi:hypothetical protein
MRRPLLPLAPCAALCLLSLAAHAAEPRKLAVLQFEVANGVVLDRQIFSAQLQNEARRAAPDLFVITQANLESLVRASGRTLEECEGQCAVSTGRLIGADLVIGGRIARLGRSLTLSMQLYDSASGQLLSGEDVRADTEEQLLDRAAEAARRLLEPLAAQGRAAVQRPRSGEPAAASAPDLEFAHDGKGSSERPPRLRPPLRLAGTLAILGLRGDQAELSSEQLARLDAALARTTRVMEPAVELMSAASLRAALAAHPAGGDPLAAGRAAGTALVLSGELRKTASSYGIFLRLQNVDTGSLLAFGTATAPSGSELPQALDRAAQQLFTLP